MSRIREYLGNAMRIILLEDDLELQTEFVRVVDQSDGDLVVVSTPTNEDDLPGVIERTGADIIFVDETPMHRTWAHVVQAVQKKVPSARIVLHTEKPTAHLLEECRRCGVRRPVRKHLPLDRLVAEMEGVIDDERRLMLGVVPEEERGDISAGGPVRRSRGGVIVMCSGTSGGASKTTTAANFALYLASNPVMPMRTALVDLEKGRGSLRVLFDPLMPAKPSILDFAEWAGKPQIPPEILKAQIPQDSPPARKYHLTTIWGSGSFDRTEDVTEELVNTLLVSLRLSHDYVIVDLPGDITDAAMGALRAATAVLWFVRADIKDMERSADVLNVLSTQANMDLAKFQVVLSMVPPKARPIYNPVQIQKALGMRIVPWYIPYDERVAMAMPGRFPAMEQRNGPYMQALKKIVEHMCPETRMEGHRGQRVGLFGLRGKK